MAAEAAIQFVSSAFVDKANAAAQKRRPSLTRYCAQSQFRQLEHPHGTALLEEVDFLCHLAAPQRHGPTPAGNHGHVLGVAIDPGDRWRNDAGARLEFPQFLARLGVDGLQEAFRRAVEHQAASRTHDATPQRRDILVFPDTSWDRSHAWRRYSPH